MLNNYFIKKSLTFCFLLFFIAFGFSQTPKQAKEITKNYNLEKLKELGVSFEKAFLKEQSNAIRLANQNGWPISYTDDNGTFHKLRKVINGRPIYLQTENIDAAISTRANYMHNGGGLGLDVEGQGMTAHVWDLGSALITHAEYDGIGGDDRYSVGDGTTDLSDHSGHVTGTIIASGAKANAKGMAPQANAIGYNWDNDLSEATNAAANGMLLSNHSYGVPLAELTGDLDWIIGAYIQDSKDWDDLMYNAPYYLKVDSAGNSGADNTSNTNPLDGNAAYDKLTFEKTAKNNLSIANGHDAVINTTGTLNSVARNSGSSEGPTEDLRIKPDLMGNGTELYSTTTTGNKAYSTYTGTSMASPNVCGTLLLLQQHHNNLKGAFMKAATLKGLALHTADDTDVVGPDANTGWGLLNAKAAAEAITNNGLDSWMSEEILNDGETFTMDVVSDGTSPLLASISWTDKGGPANNTGLLNDGTPVLVNDLDIKITQSSSTFMPWKLTGVATNTQGDNIVDPYERVDVSGASGIYTITVTHKGTLVDGLQNFSLIVTGVSSNFTLNTQSTDQTICSSNDAVYSFNYQQTGGGTTNFTLTDVPVGVTSNISPTSLNADGTFDVTFSNLTNVAANTYNINVIGDDTNETETRIIKLRVLHSDFTAYPQSLTTPVNGALEIPFALSLTWSENLNAESYLVEVSTNPSFSSIAYSATETDLSFELNDLLSETVYYWRVRPSNNCNTGKYSEIYSFQTGMEVCTSVAQLTPTTIEDLSIVKSTINYPSSFTIQDVNIIVDYSHTWIGDVSLTLISPLGTRVTLIEVLTCTDEDNFNFNFDDEATNAIDCTIGNSDYPTLKNYKPVSTLSAFNGETSNGIWTLEISDEGPADVGTVNEWTLEICEYIQSGITPNFVNNGFDAPLNSTYTFLSSDIEATTTTETAAQQVYTVVIMPTVGTLENNAVIMAVGDTFTQDDVNTGKITYVNTENSAYADQFKVDIQNAANGWLANQIITLDGLLGATDFELGNLSVWPNPAKESINIKLNNISSSANVNVNLYDIQGRIIKTVSYKTSSNTFVKTIDLNSIANGIYLLEITQGNKKATKKIVINY
jgi:subtilisin-like proprotein convertase family protein